MRSLASHVLSCTPYNMLQLMVFKDTSTTDNRNNSLQIDIDNTCIAECHSKKNASLFQQNTDRGTCHECLTIIVELFV